MIDDGTALSVEIETAVHAAPSMMADMDPWLGLAGPVVSRSQAHSVTSAAIASVEHRFRMRLLRCQSRAQPRDHACRHMGRTPRTLFHFLLHALAAVSAVSARAQSSAPGTATASLPESKAVRATGRIHL